MSEVIYVIKNLCKSYQLDSYTLDILKNVNLSVKKGDSICIRGPSGSGKSTLLNLMGSLDEPSSGERIFYGQDISSWTDQQKAFFRRDKLGFVFQFHYLLKELTVLENIQLPAYIANKPKKKSLERASFLAETLGLKERLTHYPSQLSGGELQRTSVARALMNQPELILADEPVGSLDKKNGLIIRDLFFELQETFKISLIAVSHNSFFADAFSSVLMLEDGNLKAD
ncbi:MAG: ABC transporter ATP-binding protein [Bdellovibrionales bacterium]|nr:ABC transporter ATP-binding protein [Bdellovibrionales bacterium]